MRVRAGILRCLARIRRGERGFTLIELLSAVLVTTLGAVALITTLDSSRELITFSERKESAVHVAQQELERLQTLPYAQIALDAAPACGSPCDQQDPGYYVEGSWYRWDQTPRGEVCDGAGSPPLNCEQLITGGGIDAAREIVTENGPTGGVRLRIEMQRFVTWVDDDCVKEPPDAGACGGGQDYKRITVAVRILGVVEGRREGLLNGGPGRPILLSTTVRDGETS